MVDPCREQRSFLRRGSTRGATTAPAAAARPVLTPDELLKELTRRWGRMLIVFPGMVGMGVTFPNFTCLGLMGWMFFWGGGDS